jgi:hypothetical protein
MDGSKPLLYGPSVAQAAADEATAVTGSAAIRALELPQPFDIASTVLS